MAVDLRRYRRVLALPGVAGSVALMLFARIPMTASSMVLTLHVVLTLHRGYGEAGLVGAAATIGITVGAPLVGRIVDSAGLRRMVVITTIGEGAFWLTSWLLPYPALLVAAFAGGLLSLPSMGIGRQVLTALVPEDQRRTAFSLDSISVEVSYMVGPAVGVLIATKVSTIAGLVSVGGALILSGLALYVINPPTRSAEERAVPVTGRVPRREWLNGQMIGVLATLFGAILVLQGCEIGVVAALRGVGQVTRTGPVTIVMCAASLVGGLAYGALHRSFRPAALMGLMAVLAIPIGLAGGMWWAVALALIPTNVLCAPTLSSANDQVSRLAPPAARGEANGLGSAAGTFGAALSSPLIGAVIDKAGPTAGFAVAGGGGLLIALVVLAIGRGRRRSTVPAEPEPARAK